MLYDLSILKGVAKTAVSLGVSVPPVRFHTWQAPSFHFADVELLAPACYRYPGYRVKFNVQSLSQRGIQACLLPAAHNTAADLRSILSSFQCGPTQRRR